MVIVLYLLCNIIIAAMSQSCKENRNFLKTIKNSFFVKKLNTGKLVNYRHEPLCLIFLIITSLLNSHLMQIMVPQISRYNYIFENIL